jgi:hypothetical protein
MTKISPFEADQPTDAKGAATVTVTLSVEQFEYWSEESDEYAPFDQSECVGCTSTVGAHLRAHPETDEDVPAFNYFVVLIAAGRTSLLCEDCYGLIDSVLTLGIG